MAMDHLTGPGPRPPRALLDPAAGVREIKLRPHQMAEPVTPAADLFVLAHFGVPRIDAARWSLIINGLVGRAVSLDYDDLLRRPATTVEAVHQCCGSPIEPTVPTRRVANVCWRGVDLAALLDELGVDRRARFLWAYGLDGGAFGGVSCDWFVKDLPLERLAAGDVLLAYELNGAPLPPEHGFPVRLVVPGFYGTNSVKWLWRLHLAADRAESPFTTTFYNDRAVPEAIAAGQPARRPVWAIAPEAVTVSPAPNGEVSVGVPCAIWGWAWSCRGVSGVEVSVDAGASFARAVLEPRREWAWQRFSLTWWPSTRGAVQIQARAFDADGTSQPADGARNAVHSVLVTVT
ncbi:molybdopterin-dependent oxidoreductase [Chelatococcus reniformis]|uniref:Uncharacterized protein n=1 Tax=Chelatococcus reniformis TaxID=1494448 RepID=A0A916XIT9_9HYPH|nr:molybdopterin-dependent oxidoreductase [Chelatococcus reniformis]GGC75152.1 hypothetical protein GCM10010994_36990 [Chelatococcus reniformis]